MNCKYFALHDECRHCWILNEKKGSDMDCPRPDINHFKAVEWWKENRSDNMIDFFDTNLKYKTTEENT